MSRSIAALDASLRLSCACGGVRVRFGRRLVDIADARSVTKKADAFVVVRLTPALDVRDHIARDDVDIGRAKEGVGLGRHLAANILAVHAMAFDRVVSAAGEERHACAGPPAGDRFSDLLARQFGLAQRQRVAAVTAAAVSVPLMAAKTVGALEHRFAGIGWIRARSRLAEGHSRRRQGHSYGGYRNQRRDGTHFTVRHRIFLPEKKAGGSGRGPIRPRLCDVREQTRKASSRVESASTPEWHR